MEIPYQHFGNIEIDSEGSNEGNNEEEVVEREVNIKFIIFINRY